MIIFKTHFLKPMNLLIHKILAPGDACPAAEAFRTHTGSDRFGSPLGGKSRARGPELPLHVLSTSWIKIFGFLYLLQF